MPCAWAKSSAFAAWLLAAAALWHDRAAADFTAIELIILSYLRSSRSPLLSGVGFIEEILPFTDAVPTFCIGWCLQHLWPTTPIAQKMRIDDTLPPEPKA